MRKLSWYERPARSEALSALDTGSRGRQLLVAGRRRGINRRGDSARRRRGTRSYLRHLERTDLTDLQPNPQRRAAKRAERRKEARRERRQQMQAAKVEAA